MLAGQDHPELAGYIFTVKWNFRRDRNCVLGSNLSRVCEKPWYLNCLLQEFYFTLVLLACDQMKI